MKSLVLSCFLLVIPALSFASFYEESIDDMLAQCNQQQHQVLEKNRTRHLCEKPNIDDDFSYYITNLQARFSGKKFWCFLFFKDENYKLKFKFWFSHSDYRVNAVSEDSIKCRDDSQINLLDNSSSV